MWSTDVTNHFVIFLSFFLHHFIRHVTIILLILTDHKLFITKTRKPVEVVLLPLLSSYMLHTLSPYSGLWISPMEAEATKVLTQPNHPLFFPEAPSPCQYLHFVSPSTLRPSFPHILILLYIFFNNYVLSHYFYMIKPFQHIPFYSFQYIQRTFAPHSH